MTLSPQDRADGRRLEQAATKGLYEEVDRQAREDPRDVVKRARDIAAECRTWGVNEDEVDYEEDPLGRPWLITHLLDVVDAVRVERSALLAADEDRETFKSAWEAAADQAKKAILEMAEERKQRKAAEAALARERQAHATLNTLVEEWKQHAHPQTSTFTEDGRRVWDVCATRLAAALASPSSPEQEPQP